jgi:hypothetical protein
MRFTLATGVPYQVLLQGLPWRMVPSSEPPTDSDRRLVDCPACLDERGEPTGEVLVQRPSGTWVREKCDLCAGLRKVDDTALALYLVSPVVVNT